MEKANEQRREFFKRGILGFVSLALFPIMGSKALSVMAHAKDKLEPLSESDTLAKTLGYHKAASKVDVKKWPKRAGAEGAKQFCDNCMFYQGAGKAQGSCQIFQGKSIEAKGWCNSWAPKAG